MTGARPLLGESGVVSVAPQPAPTLREQTTPSIQELVRRDLIARETVGVERYGTALYPHNGRDALRDAYEEALDLACYLRQAMAERDSPREER